MNPDAFTVAILAGGAATRLGGIDKGLAPLHGRPLIEWSLASARRMLARGDNADETTDQAARLLIVANRNHEVYAGHARTIADIAPGFHGPLAGIASALTACTTPWLVTVPVDDPAPPSDLAVRLIAEAGAGSCAVAHDGRRRQPLHAAYRRNLAVSAGAALAAGQGVHAWQHAMAAHEVDFSACHSHFANLNTPGDFAAHGRD